MANRPMNKHKQIIEEDIFIFVNVLIEKIEIIWIETNHKWTWSGLKRSIVCVAYPLTFVSHDNADIGHTCFPYLYLAKQLNMTTFPDRVPITISISIWDYHTWYQNRNLTWFWNYVYLRHNKTQILILIVNSLQHHTIWNIQRKSISIEWIFIQNALLTLAFYLCSIRCYKHNLFYKLEGFFSYTFSAHGFKLSETNMNMQMNTVVLNLCVIVSIYPAFW